MLKLILVYHLLAIENMCKVNDRPAGTRIDNGIVAPCNLRTGVLLISGFEG